MNRSTKSSLSLLLSATFFLLSHTSVQAANNSATTITKEAAVTSISYNGVQLNSEINIVNKKLKLNGQGMREKFFIDLYIGSLYLEKPNSDATSILKSKKTSAIKLNIVSSLITAEKMKNAILSGFEKATNDKLEPIQPQINEFMAVFDSKISEGDRFTLVSQPSKGIIAYKNGEKLALIPGEKFRIAVLKIWLGDDPIQTSLKKGMLQGK